MELNQESNTDDKILILVEISRMQQFNDILNIPNTEGIRLDERNAIIITEEDKIEDIKKIADLVNYEEIPEIYTLTEISPVEASNALKFINNENLRLNGSGTLIGLIDTGIDYLNNEFLREDGSSRIFRLWDQTLPNGKPIYGLRYGVEYTNDNINEAIKLNNNKGNPYSIVPSRDEIGHGTMMASILGATGKNPDILGMAPNCDFVVVKLQQADKEKLAESYIDSKVPMYGSLNIILALRYFTSLASEFDKPISIYIPLGSNLGGHQGNNILESVINRYTGFSKLVIVTNTGNQGNTDTHTEGKLTKEVRLSDIPLRVGRLQKKLPIQIWVRQGIIADLAIISPSGELINKLNPKTASNRVIKFFYEETEMNINYIYPEKDTGDALINIRASNLKEGVWIFRLSSNDVMDSEYFAWIPQRELIDENTKFLRSSTNTTMTIPSTANRVIATSYYNQTTRGIVSDSGRGYPVSDIIKPDVTAGGINAVVTTTGGGTRNISGGSVAGAVVAGGCALILQWAVILGNDLEINYKKIRSYIISGTDKRPGDIYPNSQWGFGIFNLDGIFNVIKNVSAARDSKELYDEYYVDGLFVRKPKEI